MATELSFKPYAPAVWTLEGALLAWMRAFVHRYAGPFYRVTFEQQGAGPAVAATAYRINIFTDRQRQRNGVSFSAGSVSALASAVNIEAPKFHRKTTR